MREKYDSIEAEEILERNWTMQQSTGYSRMDEHGVSGLMYSFTRLDLLMRQKKVEPDIYVILLK